MYGAGREATETFCLKHKRALADLAAGEKRRLHIYMSKHTLEKVLNCIDAAHAC